MGYAFQLKLKGKTRKRGFTQSFAKKVESSSPNTCGLFMCSPVGMGGISIDVRNPQGGYGDQASANLLGPLLL
jgi:hypothetical protein